LALKSLLIDTGPIVAYLDRGDAEHTRIASILDNFTGTLFTTSAVITESMHLLKEDRNGPRRLVEFIQAVAIQISECARLQDLFSAVLLIEKYSDTPMDFADATLVALSEQLGTNRIVTLDRRGFSTFRTRTGKHFEVFPV
jgi:uncharacterized protein